MKDLTIHQAISLVEDGCQDVIIDCLGMTSEFVLNTVCSIDYIIRGKYRIKQTDFDKHMEGKECPECKGKGNTLEFIAYNGFCRRCNG